MQSGRRVLISVHGIRTFGQWQERLAALLKQQDQTAECFSYHYGFFSALAFILPPLRAIEVRRFRRHLLKILSSRKDAAVSLVGHSFGTHLIAWALAKGLPDGVPPLRRVILAGSVLKSTFDWHDLIEQGVVEMVINDCGIDDNVLLLSQSLVLFTGMAGRLGFTGALGTQLLNRYFRGGHSLYFVGPDGHASDAFMAANWIPLLVESEVPNLLDERAVGGPLQGVKIWLIQNADVVKVGFIVGCALSAWQSLYEAPRALAYGAELQRQQAVAISLLAVDGQVPQAVATLANIARSDRNATDARELAAYWLPQLVDFDEDIKNRGLPALFTWQGRNLLVTKSGTRELAGPGIIKYGFSTDGQEIVAFDVESGVRRIDVESGEVIQSIPSGMEMLPSGQAGSAGVGPTAFAQETSRMADLQDVGFFESPDGRYFIGVGPTASYSANGWSPAIFVIERRRGWFAFFSHNRFSVQFVNGQIEVWTQSFDLDLDDSSDRLCKTNGDPCYRLTLAVDQHGFVLSNERQTPASVVADIRKGRAGVALPLAWSIGSTKFNSLRENERDNFSVDDLATYFFPAERRLTSEWAFADKPPGTPPSSGLSVADLELLLGGVSKHGADWTHLKNQIEIVARDNLVVASVTQNAGAGFGERQYCSGASVSEMRACTSVNFHGAFGAHAFTPDLTVLAVSDFPSMGHPSLHVFDTTSMEAVPVDILPAGPVRTLAFVGTVLYVASDAGLYIYDVETSGIRLRTVRRATGAELAAEAFPDVSLATLARGVATVNSNGLVTLYRSSDAGTEWVTQLRMERNGVRPTIHANEKLPFMAVQDGKCVHLIHVATGGKVAPVLCTDDIERIELSDDGTVRVVTPNTLLSRRLRVDTGDIASLGAQGENWFYRLRSFFKAADSEPASAHRISARTGHEATTLPVRPLKDLPVRR